MCISFLLIFCITSGGKDWGQTIVKAIIQTNIRKQGKCKIGKDGTARTRSCKIDKEGGISNGIGLDHDRAVVSRNNLRKLFPISRRDF